MDGSIIKTDLAGNDRCQPWRCNPQDLCSSGIADSFGKCCQIAPELRHAISSNSIIGIKPTFGSNYRLPFQLVCFLSDMANATSPNVPPLRCANIAMIPTQKFRFRVQVILGHSFPVSLKGIGRDRLAAFPVKGSCSDFGRFPFEWSNWLHLLSYGDT